MNIVGSILLSVSVLLVVIACTGGGESQSADPTATPEPTQDVQATVEAGITATKEAEQSIEATIAAGVEATKAAEPTPEPSATAYLPPTAGNTRWPENTPSPLVTGDPASTTDVSDYTISACQDMMAFAVDQTQNVISDVLVIKEIPDIEFEHFCQTLVRDFREDLADSNYSFCQDVLTFLINASKDAISVIEITDLVLNDDILTGCQSLIQYSTTYAIDTIMILFNEPIMLDIYFFTIEDWNCEDFLSIILNVAREQFEKRESDLNILRVYDVDEIEWTPQRLSCGAFARTPRRELYLKFDLTNLTYGRNDGFGWSYSIEDAP